MQNEIDTLEFVQGVHFEIINCLKNNGTKYLLIFEDSCAETCNCKEFLDIDTAGKGADLVLFTLNTNYSIKVN